MYLALPVCLPEGLVTCKAAFQIELTPSTLRIIAEAIKLARWLRREQERFVSLDYSFSEGQGAWLEVDGNIPKPFGCESLFYPSQVVKKIFHLEDTRFTVTADGLLFFHCYTTESDELSAGPIRVDAWSDPRTIWIEAGDWICRPQLETVTRTVQLPDGLNGGAAKFFALPSEERPDGTVKLALAVPGKDYLFRWCQRAELEAALQAQS